MDRGRKDSGRPVYVDYGQQLRAHVNRAPPSGKSERKSLEIIRLYYPSGGLQAERLRIREHDSPPLPQRSDAQEAGCLALLFLAGTAWAAGAAGGALAGGWGVVVGLLVWAGMVWSWM